MEQLAQFVTKSFEYNNNTNSRVQDLLSAMSVTRVTTKIDECSEVISINGNLETDQDDESVDIDITDLSGTENKDNNNISENRPLSLVKISETLEKPQQIQTKNWLISDSSPKRKFQEIGRIGNHLRLKDIFKFNSNSHLGSIEPTALSSSTFSASLTSITQTSPKNSALNLIRVSNLEKEIGKSVEIPVRMRAIGYGVENRGNNAAKDYNADGNVRMFLSASIEKNEKVSPPVSQPSEVVKYEIEQNDKEKRFHSAKECSRTDYYEGKMSE